MKVVKEGRNRIPWKIDHEPGRDSENDAFESKTFRIIVLAASITCFLAFFSNLFTEFRLFVNIILGLSGLTFLLFFYLSSFRRITWPLFFPFRILLLIIIITNFLSYQGLEGSTPFYIILALVGLIYSSPSRLYWYTLAFYLVLALSLVMIAIFFPQWTTPYANKSDQLTDLFLSFVITVGLVGYVTMALKKSFDRERMTTKQKKDELEISEARFRDIVTSSSDWIWEVDAEGKYTFCSKKVIEILGYTPEEIIGKTPFDLMPENEANAVAELFGQLQSEHKPFHNLENRNYTKDGRLVWILTNGTPIIDPQGHLIGYRGADKDITQRKENESALRLAKEKAEESEKLKAVFLANMSHEIRTPMNGILGFTELLKEPDLTPEEQKKYIGIIEASGERLLSIINDIISLSKVESGQTVAVLSNTHINEQIDYVYNFFRPEADKKGIVLLDPRRLPVHEAVVMTDREKVYAILTNLVKNAIKFTHAGKVEFGCVRKGEDLEFFVSDTGIGIPQNEVPKVFDRFRQVDNSLTRSPEGSGLGLTISKAYVEMLGGRIWLSSIENEGSTFRFTIPCHPVVEK